jgi:hypothetical protein
VPHLIPESFVHGLLLRNASAAPWRHAQGIFNDDAFAKMKRGARLVNVARGGVVDDASLVRALDAGIVAQVQKPAETLGKPHHACGPAASTPPRSCARSTSPSSRRRVCPAAKKHEIIQARGLCRQCLWSCVHAAHKDGSCQVPSSA